ncbi:hypothetical protein ACFP81_10190 [Deinococcus lacus]|uniref:Uncharacterized protein n=1 Tax=Deinococcus lacus TaxID=392561 RepID=A0ABW1YHI6_9DEIO
MTGGAPRAVTGHQQRARPLQRVLRGHIQQPVSALLPPWPSPSGSRPRSAGGRKVGVGRALRRAGIFPGYRATTPA